MTLARFFALAPTLAGQPEPVEPRIELAFERPRPDSGCLAAFQCIDEDEEDHDLTDTFAADVCPLVRARTPDEVGP